MGRNLALRVSWMILLVGLAAGCASTNKPRLPDNPDPAVRGELTAEKARGALRMKLAKQMKYLEENRERFRKQVTQVPSGSDTYYYKYYDDFPEGPINAKLTVTPTETFSPVYEAEAKYRKVRYQTRYTKSRNRAGADDDFIRDEGIQKEIYKFDGQKWQLMSSVFEVITTSVYEEDGWTASRGRIRRVEEEKPEPFVDKVRSLFGLLD